MATDRFDRRGAVRVARRATEAATRTTLRHMGGKWPVGATMLFAVVTACAPAPPPYESRYVPPSPTSPPPPQLAPGASFVDDFNRPDTEAGLGAAWDMRGAEIVGNPILPPTTDGSIIGGQFMASGDSSVYAVREFRSAVRRIGAEGRWTRVGNGGEETFVMAVSANEKLRTDMVHFAATPAGWGVTTRRNGGVARHVMGGKFHPPLDLNRSYRFEMDIADGSVTVRVPGMESTGKVGTIGLVGNRAFWQLYPSPSRIPLGVRYSADMVWVAEDNQPLTPLPSA